jgi:hypothetical protein
MLEYYEARIKGLMSREKVPAQFRAHALSVGRTAENDRFSNRELDLLEPRVSLSKQTTATLSNRELSTISITHFPIETSSLKLRPRRPSAIACATIIGL